MGASPQLTINPEFRLMVAPYQERTRQAREVWMKDRGKSLPIRVWNNTILVDYEIYDYCCTHNLSLHLSWIVLKSYEDALIWICKDQLKRTDIPEEVRKYLIGKRYHAEKKRGAQERTAARQAIRAGEKSVGFMNTPMMYEATAIQAAARIGAEYHISPGTVRKYAANVTVIDHLHELEPELVCSFFQGTITLSHESLMVMSAMNRAEIALLARYFLDGKENKPTFVKFRAKQAEKKQRARNAPAPVGSIKEMPVYDPDAVVASLALTIPSWIGSIQRAGRNTEFSQISDRIRFQLLSALEDLSEAIEALSSCLKEEQHG